MPNRAPIHKPSYWKPRPPRVDEREKTAHQRGYDSRWQRARLAFLHAHPLCVHCEQEGRVAPATVVDHIVPHRGDRARFWDQANWQPLCTYHHNAKTARGE